MTDSTDRLAWRAYASAALQGLLARPDASSSVADVLAACLKYAEALCGAERDRFAHGDARKG
jgi:hypothetical protein